MLKFIFHHTLPDSGEAGITLYVRYAAGGNELFTLSEARLPVGFAMTSHIKAVKRPKGMMAYSNS